MLHLLHHKKAQCIAAGLLRLGRHSSFQGDEPRFHLDGTHIPFVVVVVSTRWFPPPVLSDSFPISGLDLDAHAAHDQQGEGLGTLSTK